MVKKDRKKKAFQKFTDEKVAEIESGKRTEQETPAPNSLKKSKSPQRKNEKNEQLLLEPKNVVIDPDECADVEEKQLEVRQTSSIPDDKRCRSEYDNGSNTDNSRNKLTRTFYNTERSNSRNSERFGNDRDNKTYSGDVSNKGNNRQNFAYNDQEKSRFHPRQGPNDNMPRPSYSSKIKFNSKPSSGFYDSEKQPSDSHQRGGDNNLSKQSYNSEGLAQRDDKNQALDFHQRSADKTWPHQRSNSEGFAKIDDMNQASDFHRRGGDNNFSNQSSNSKGFARVDDKNQASDTHQTGGDKYWSNQSYNSEGSTRLDDKNQASYSHQEGGDNKRPNQSYNSEEFTKVDDKNQASHSGQRRGDNNRSQQRYNSDRTGSGYNGTERSHRGQRNDPRPNNYSNKEYSQHKDSSRGYHRNTRQNNRHSSGYNDSEKPGSYSARRENDNKSNQQYNSNRGSRDEKFGDQMYGKSRGRGRGSHTWDKDSKVGYHHSSYSNRGHSNTNYDDGRNSRENQPWDDDNRCSNDDSKECRVETSNSSWDDLPKDNKSWEIEKGPLPQPDDFEEERPSTEGGSTKFEEEWVTSDSDSTLLHPVQNEQIQVVSPRSSVLNPEANSFHLPNSPVCGDMCSVAEGGPDAEGDQSYHGNDEMGGAYLTEELQSCNIEDSIEEDVPASKSADSILGAWEQPRAMGKYSPVLSSGSKVHAQRPSPRNSLEGSRTSSDMYGTQNEQSNANDDSPNWWRTKDRRSGSKKDTSYENQSFKSKAPGRRTMDEMQDIFREVEEGSGFLKYLNSEDFGNYVRVTEVEKDLFAVGTEYALAHCVAEDMNMGSGIAVRFRSQFKRVEDLLKMRQKQGGLAYLTLDGRNIYYMVTKQISSGKPTYLTFWRSLIKLRNHMKEENVTKLAIPRIGCGLDRLEWSAVKPMLEYMFRDQDVEILVCNFQDENPIATRNSINKCRVVYENNPIAKIAEQTIIIYFASSDGQVTKTMADLDAKFNFLLDFKRARKSLGEPVRFDARNNLYILYGCVVREREKDPFDFVGFRKCLNFIQKNNKKDGFYYVGFQRVQDDEDSLLNEKILNIMRDSLKDVEIYCCGSGDSRGVSTDDPSGNK